MNCQENNIFNFLLASAVGPWFPCGGLYVLLCLYMPVPMDSQNKIALPIPFNFCPTRDIL